jgi:hypothetical protein
MRCIPLRLRFVSASDAEVPLLFFAAVLVTNDAVVVLLRYAKFPL